MFITSCTIVVFAVIHECHIEIRFLNAPSPSNYCSTTKTQQHRNAIRKNSSYTVVNNSQKN